MYTIDRINALRKHYGLLPHLLPLDLWKEGGCHKYLNELDRCAGIDTRWRDYHLCPRSPDAWDCRGNHTPRYVGARLALHEQHLKKRLEPERRPYFWLGAEAEWCDAA